MNMHNRDYRVYKPAEDTFLLADEVQKEIGDNALEIGVGSGYITLQIAKKVEHVVGTDINPEALGQTRKRVEAEDLISSVDLICCSATRAFVDGCFDLIVFNSPYLPSHSLEDIAVDGGSEGIEVALDVLLEATRTITRNGKILFTASSHSNYRRLMKSLSGKGFTSRIKARRRFFFEDLMVVEAVRRT